jgi:hypothetical protein
LQELKIVKYPPYFSSLSLFDLDPSFRLSEPELLEKVITDGNWTEVKVSALIKRLLSILRELQHLKILHLDIKVGKFYYIV